MINKSGASIAADYPGYKAGKTPRKVFINGKSYPVQYIVYTAKLTDMETFKETEILKLNLPNYGECDVAGKGRWSYLEEKDSPAPPRKFSDIV